MAPNNPFGRQCWPPARQVMRSATSVCMSPCGYSTTRCQVWPAEQISPTQQLSMQVIIPAPFWVSYPEMASLAGAAAVIVETSADQGFLMSAEQLKAALTPKSRLLILCSPSNPTGAVYSK